MDLFSFDYNNLTLKKCIKTILFGYLLMSLIGAIPFLFTGTKFVDAFFEGISMVTLTGATCFTCFDNVSPFLLFWRSIFTWFCGLLTLLIFIFILPCVKRQSIFLFEEKYLGYSVSKMLIGMKKMSRFVILSYFILTIFVFCGLYFSGINIFDAFHYACGTVSTSGFRIHDNFLLGNLTNAEKIVISIGMFFAAGNYALYGFVYYLGIHNFRKNTEFKVYVSILLGGVLLSWISVKLSNINNLNSMDILFQVTSFLSTTGYCVNHIFTWTNFAQVLFGFLIIVGGCIGSCSGGLKICRLVLLLKQLNRDIRKIFSPKLIESLSINGQEVSEKSLISVTFFFVTYIVLIFVVATFLAVDDFDVVDALLTSASCISNTGVVFNSSFLNGTFSVLSLTGKIAVMAGMLFGRLEILMVLVILLPEFWETRGNW